MPEAGFPQSVSTETQAQPTSSLLVDITVLRSVPGYVKFAEIGFDLLGFICIISTILSYTPRGTWFNTVAMGGFWYSSIMLAFYVFRLREKLKVIPWAQIELGFCVLWTIFYLIAASLVANYGWFNEAFAAAAFFGFVAMVAYAIDAYLNFRQLRGITVITKTTATSSTSPTHY